MNVSNNTTGGKHSAAKRSMLATAEIPEIPEIPVYVTHEMSDEMELLYVTSEHEKVRMPEFENLIVRCSICGYETIGTGMMRGTAFEDQNMHFASRHRGSKTVWHPETIPDREEALKRPHSLRESSATTETENEWDAYAFRAMGDCPDERATEMAMKHMDQSPSSVVIEHRPPIEPYPDSPEEGFKSELREVKVV